MKCRICFRARCTILSKKRWRSRSLSDGFFGRVGKRLKPYDSTRKNTGNFSWGLLTPKNDPARRDLPQSAAKSQKSGKSVFLVWLFSESDVWWQESSQAVLFWKPSTFLWVNCRNKGKEVTVGVWGKSLSKYKFFVKSGAWDGEDKCRKKHSEIVWIAQKNGGASHGERVLKKRGKRKSRVN